ncbi:hypothetical protein [Dubosiella newyorkensis]|uniref:hypothetical protein n=1 Tax=Dubosiella newyorkensis TaxID=1862672 RepID=UPI00272B3D04|nr:hypothetical protein [Dubosiella newyorkensis]
MTIKMKANDSVFYVNDVPYPIESIEKIDILMEDKKFKGKTKPFVHQICGGATTIVAHALFEPSGFVGLRIRMKDQTIADYISKEPVYHNTDPYQKDMQTAEEIKRKLLKNQRLQKEKSNNSL